MKNTSKVLKGQTENESEIDGWMSQSVFLSLIPFKIESTQNTYQICKQSLSVLQINTSPPFKTISEVVVHNAKFIHSKIQINQKQSKQAIQICSAYSVNMQCTDTLAFVERPFSKV